MPEGFKKFLEKAGRWIKGEYETPTDLAVLLRAALQRVDDAMVVQSEEFKNKSCPEAEAELSAFSSHALTDVTRAFDTYFENPQARQSQLISQAYRNFLQDFDRSSIKELPDLMKKLLTDIEQAAERDENFKNYRNNR